RRRQRTNPLWRYTENGRQRQGRLGGSRSRGTDHRGGRIKAARCEIGQQQIVREEIGQARGSEQEQNAGEKGGPLAMATGVKETGIKPAAATQVSFLEAIKQALYEEMERDPAVVLIGEDIGVYGGAFKTSEGLLERFGWERVIDTPISESAIVGAACGMSYLGLRPIAEMQFIDFIVCAFNQITNFVAKGHYLWNAPAPMVIRGPSGG